MTQNRSNCLAITHCHKEGPDTLDPAAVSTEVVLKHDTRKTIFWRFSANDFAQPI